MCELRRHCRSRQKKTREVAVQNLQKRGIVWSNAEQTFGSVWPATVAAGEACLSYILFAASTADERFEYI